ncbi:hypothetical protein ACFQ60_22315 [Streptomyces zhihengii]|uniref:Uncharacterized protein n=1 Tax=Streptomyces zhihengii TaxID=1818004 RepID=A0ABS2UUC2_9ACTN|nr:hypothetical protein [Streptomyces zhihengii]MBM9621038.1 hypothetical protein [Streptomyces zhihengii]
MIKVNKPADVPTEPQPIVWQPYLYYRVTARDDNEDCVNYEQVFLCEPFYSNDGAPIRTRAVCGRCGHDMTLLTAELLVPQPEVS